jgi:pilus assembly protein Flp/PilA
MQAITQFFRRLGNDDSGATAMEYGLLIALMGAAIVTGATNAGTGITNLFNDIGTKLTNYSVKIGT